MKPTAFSPKASSWCPWTGIDTERPHSAPPRAGPTALTKEDVAWEAPFTLPMSFRGVLAFTCTATQHLILVQSAAQAAYSFLQGICLQCS